MERAVDKKKARINCIHHLLEQITYNDVEHAPFVLPPRIRHGDTLRRPIPQEILVPEIY